MNNPHICAIHDIGDGYLVMEYIEGAPVRGPLSVNLSLDYAIQIATALEAAHSRGIIHSDLKPENVIVTRENIVKLLDFGHARRITSDPMAADPVLPPGTGLGTAAYTSPEQARGKPADPRSDIFAFGAVLYEMLSGRRAFAGNTLLEVLNNIVNNEPRPLETTREFRHILTRCLRKNPADRFQSVSEIREALARVSVVTVSEKRPSIAVLPFANLSADPGNEYFSDGLTEEIISELSRIPGLRVTAHTSAFVFRKRDEDVRIIAQKLNVETILEGSVRQSGAKIRVAAQLISACDGCHLWSQTYDRELTDVFEIQDDIAEAIARALQLRLYHGTKVTIPAYEAYLKARYYMLRGREFCGLSRECYEQAIALDGTFALAHSGHAENDFYSVFSGTVPAAEAMPVVRARARRALDIDPWLPEAHAMLGTVATIYDYDRHQAERHFQLAIAREGVSTAAHLLHASYYLLATGEAEEAEEEIEQVLRDDPLNKALHYRLGVCRMKADAEEASRAFQVALEFDPNFIWAMTMLSITYWWRRMDAEALAWAAKAHSVTPDDPAPAGLLAGILICTGEPAAGKRVIEQLGDGQGYGSPIGLMVFDSLIGETDTAAFWLEKAIHQHCDLNAFELLHTPLCEGLSPCSWWATLSKIVDLAGSSSPLRAELKV
jgi:serine/threonine-protein kinase